MTATVEQLRAAGYPPEVNEALEELLAARQELRELRRDVIVLRDALTQAQAANTSILSAYTQVLAPIQAIRDWLRQVPQMPQ